MITDVINGDIFNTPHKHIAFAINTEGFNDSGFAGQVAMRAPQITTPSIGGNNLGDVVSAEVEGKTFHGLVCHSLKENGWKHAPSSIIECLNKINVSDDEPIAIILMGAGMIGQMSGADIKANINAIYASKKNCIIYTPEYTKKAVLDVVDKKLLKS